MLSVEYFNSAFLPYKCSLITEGRSVVTLYWSFNSMSSVLTLDTSMLVALLPCADVSIQFSFPWLLKRKKGTCYQFHHYDWIYVELLFKILATRCRFVCTVYYFIKNWMLERTKCQQDLMFEQLSETIKFWLLFEAWAVIRNQYWRMHLGKKLTKWFLQLLSLIKKIWPKL